MTPLYPAFGICGFSGAGKTTLIEAVVGDLTRRGLKAGVVKHGSHGIEIDRPGKDTDRIFQAGADVAIRTPRQGFYRTHGGDDLSLHEVLWHMGPYYDIIIVEGHKRTHLEQKIWLCKEGDTCPPPEAGVVQRVLRQEEDREKIAMEMMEEWLARVWTAAPVYAGILIGGESSRFGQPKHLVRGNGKTWLRRTVEQVRPHVDEIVFLGGGEVPQALSDIPHLPDVPGVSGPRAGMLAAMRWHPRASWLFLACDLPLLSSDAVRWLLAQRKPGKWAVLPRRFKRAPPEPLFAHYDLRAAPLLEYSQPPRELQALPQVSTPVVPHHLQEAWHNVNTPQDLSALYGAGRTSVVPPR